MRLSRIALTVIALCFAAGLASAQPASTSTAPARITLRLKLIKGAPYALKSNVEQEITQGIGGGQKYSQTIGFGLSFNVQDVAADGTMAVRVAFDSVSMRMHGPGVDVAYDSVTGPAEPPPAAKGFAALVGQGFDMKLTPLGEVKEITGVDDMLAAVVRKMEGADEKQRAELDKALRTQFGDESLKQMMGQQFNMLPENPVGVGETWSRKLTLKVGIPMAIESTYTLKSRADGVAKVAVAIKITPNPDAAAMEVGPAKIKQSLAGVQSGTMDIDEATGWTKGAEMSQDLKGEIAVQMQGQAPTTQPLAIKSRIVVTPK